MTESLVLRIGAVGAVGGGVLLLVGNAAHPREDDQLEDAAALMTVVADSEIWVADHLVIAAGIALLFAGYFGLSRSIAGTGVPWASLGYASAIIGAGIGLLFMLTEAIAVVEVADDWADAGRSRRRAALAAGDAIFQLSLTLSVVAALVLFGLTPVFFGLALAHDPTYASWLGWPGVVAGGLTTVASVAQVLSAPTTVTGLVLVPLGIVVGTLWMIGLGVTMWRRSGTR